MERPVLERCIVRHKSINNIISGIFQELQGRFFRSLFLGVSLMIIFLAFHFYVRYPISKYCSDLWTYFPVFSSIIITPLLEEYFKRISILLGTTLFFCLLLVGSEFVLYAIKHLSYGESWRYVLSVRTPPLLIHIITILIQKKNIDDGTGKLGFWIAVLIHFAYNASKYRLY